LAIEIAGPYRPNPSYADDICRAIMINNIKLVCRGWIWNLVNNVRDAFDDKRTWLIIYSPRNNFGVLIMRRTKLKWLYNFRTNLDIYSNFFCYLVYEISPSTSNKYLINHSTVFGKSCISPTLGSLDLWP